MQPLTLGMLNLHGFTTTPEIDGNLEVLLIKSNSLQTLYRRLLIPTSGLRSQELQATLFKTGKSTATQSKHLFGQAVDFADPNRELMHFILGNLDLMQQLGLWFEDFRYCNSKTGISWVHAQIVPPKSGHRIYIPSSLAPADPSCWDGNYDRKFDS